MFIKKPPPIPRLWPFIIELHRDVEIAASTADPPFKRIFLKTIKINSSL